MGRDRIETSKLCNVLQIILRLTLISPCLSVHCFRNHFVRELHGSVVSGVQIYCTSVIRNPLYWPYLEFFF